MSIVHDLRGTVSASNYGAPLFNLPRSRLNYRSSCESLGVAFLQSANALDFVTGPLLAIDRLILEYVSLRFFFCL